MLLATVALFAGLGLLIWSADRFIEAAAAAARHFGMPSLLIGVIIVGFGTSAPEMVVSAIAAVQGDPGIALGNAYGSNIANIGLILGLTAIISPIAVHSQVLRREMPVLGVVTALTVILLLDDDLGRFDATVLLVSFAVIMSYAIWLGLRGGEDAFGAEIEHELIEHPMPLRRALILLSIGLVVLVVSSRLLVWGGVELAEDLGVSDLIIGLTIVAFGTSLPELASSLAAVRKNEHDIALGNVIGSNLFNTLAVVGIAGAIDPTPLDSDVLRRDVVVMAALTVSLFVVATGFRGPGRINRFEGGGLLCAYLAYTSYLVVSVI